MTFGDSMRGNLPGTGTGQDPKLLKDGHDFSQPPTCIFAVGEGCARVA